MCVCVCVYVCTFFSLPKSPRCFQMIELSFVRSERTGSSIRYACRDILVDCRRLLARHVCLGNMRVLKIINIFHQTRSDTHVRSNRKGVGVYLFNLRRELARLFLIDIVVLIFSVIHEREIDV